MLCIKELLLKLFESKLSFDNAFEQMLNLLIPIRFNEYGAVEIFDDEV